MSQSTKSFRSADLKRWELQSILPSFHECPELFELPVDGNENNRRWVLYGAPSLYYIGDFDGASFTPESEKLHKKKHSFSDEVLEPGKNPLSTINGDLFDIRAEFDVRDASEIGFEIRGVPVVYNAREKTLSCKEKKAPCEPVDGKIKLQLLVDRTSIEVFINDGQYFMSMGSIPGDDDRSLKVFAKGGDARIISLDVNELKSAWQ